LLVDADLGWLADFPGERVDFAAVEPLKMRALARAAERFTEGASDERRAAYDAFVKDNRSWLDDFALFMALHEVHGGAWQSWDERVARRSPDALAEARATLAKQVDAQVFAQFAFTEQWTALRSYAAERAVRIVGDLPIFVALDSADVWSHPELFLLDDNGLPTV